MKEWKLDISLIERAKKHGFYYRGRHLPYNPNLKDRARELRKNMTTAEKKLWYQFLRNSQYSVLRQRPIDNYIVDFYCPSLNLVIEIDGDSHFTEEGLEYDKERTKILENYGLKVFRFNNFEVLRNFESVCEEIERQFMEHCNKAIPPGPP